MTFDDDDDPRPVRTDDEVLAAALRAADASVIVTAADRDQPILYANAAFERLTGYAREEVIGRNCRILQCRDTDPEAIAELRDAVAERRPGRATLLNVRKDGRHFHNDVLIAPVEDARGDVTAFVGVQVDVTEQQGVLERLGTAEERYRRILETAQEGICLYDAQQRLTYVNERFAQLVGAVPEELLGKHTLEVIHPESVERVRRGLRERILGEVDRYDVRLLHRTGAPVWVQVSTAPLLDFHGQFEGALAMIGDIGERKRHEDQLAALASRDPLTGLHNRRALAEELERRIARFGRYGTDSTLVLLDVDDFKLVNDAHGHARGDELLVALGDVLTRELRETDVAARLGGDEFAILLDGSEAVTRDAVTRILGEAAAVSAGVAAALSAGSVALSELAGAEADRVLATADAALYEAKDRGKAQRVHHSGERRSLLTWADEVRRVLDDGRLVLHGQPIVDLRTGQRIADELLLRYLDEEGEAHPPAALLRAAERFGRVAEIDRFALARGAELAGEGQTVHVNVSGRSVADPELLPFVAERLGSVAAASRLVVEITETYAIADLVQAAELAQGLRELGCRIALDDFGTGFASFAALRRLPVDMLKIDIEFVQSVGRSRIDRSIVRSIVALGHELGRITVAEGVEDEDTLETLTALGVDAAQGFFLGRPAAYA